MKALIVLIVVASLSSPNIVLAVEKEYDPYLGLFEKITVMEIALAGMRKDISYLQAEAAKTNKEVDVLQSDTAEVKKKMYALFLLGTIGLSVVGLILNHNRNSQGVAP